MSFTPQFNISDLMKDADIKIENIKKNIETELIRIGLQFVIDARSKVSNQEYKVALGSMSHAKGIRRAELGPESPGFMDHSGALRSSISFTVFRDGKSIHEDFETSNKGDASGKSEGLEQAKKLTKQVLDANPDVGLLLVVTAGMEYVAHVEGYGYDVITGSSLTAENSLRKFFNK